MAELYPIGTLCWAKMKGFPPWPGRVSLPPSSLKKSSASKKGTSMHCIYFFGSNNYAWIEESQIKPYEAFKEQFGKAAKASLKEAIDAIEDYINNKGGEDIFATVPDPEAEFNKLKESTLENEQKDDKEKKKEKKENQTPKEHKAKKPKIQKDSLLKKRKEGRLLSSSPIMKKSRKDLDDTESNDTILLNHTSSIRKSCAPGLLQRPSANFMVSSQQLDLESVSQTLKDKNILPSKLKFGFLGLGIMGSGIVKNLLNSGHSVVVWNRTTDKCDKFVTAGAELGMTPSDVVASADITFSCVADPQAAKDMVFGNCGVLSENLTDKGYIEMTGIDPETSQDIADSITGKGGRYLEAQIQGSRTQAEEGTLIILAAGDRSLFDECQSCFEAMGRNSFYLGEVGNASRMNLVLQMMNGVALAGLAEGLALADRAGLQQKDVMEVLELTQLACPMLVDKGKAIIEGGFPTHLALMHMQKDLRLSLSMGDRLEQPLPLSATANEIFKHAKRLGYSEHDVSSVYIRARF